ncbi:hypothetical protein L1049_007277 [Liquidambar formosana]|uniref:NAA35-like TPR repeats domain-containing protein n=1 Tax=Liquidambar formosana TaxID=63359 RepID=A0AAP0RIQ1_LIQFO
MRRPQGRGLELARKHIASYLSVLDCIRRSSDFLRSSARNTSEHGVDDRTTASGCQPIGFNATLNSRLSAPTPPRAIRTLSWEKAVEYFEKLLNDLDIICSYSLDPLFERVLRFVVQFQKSQPDLVARAHLQVLLVQDGKLYGRDPIFSVISRAAALPEVTKDHDIQKNEYVLQLGQSILVRNLDLFQLFGPLLLLGWLGTPKKWSIGNLIISIIAENFVTNRCNSEAKAVVPPIKIKKANKKRAASSDSDLASSRDLDDTGAIGTDISVPILALGPFCISDGDGF